MYKITFSEVKMRLGNQDFFSLVHEPSRKQAISCFANQMPAFERERKMMALILDRERKSRMIVIPRL